MDKMDFIKESMCAAKDVIKKMRRQATDWEKISVNHIHIYIEYRQTSQNSVV